MKKLLVSSAVAVAAFTLASGCAGKGKTQTAGTTTPAVAPLEPLEPTKPLEMVVLPSANKPVVSFRFVFRTGSVDDPKGKEGLTALTANVLQEGGTKELSSSQLLEALFPMAGEISVLVDKELTVFAGRVHKDNLDRFLKIFTDLLIEPRFDPSEFDRLRSDQLNHLKNELRSQDDEGLGKAALDAVLFKDHPYRHYVYGTVKGLEATTLEDVKAHAKNVFTQDRLIVGLAGAVDAALEQKVKERLSLLPATGQKATVIPPAPVVKNEALIVEKDAISTAISAGYAWRLRRGHPDFYKVAFALSYLGEHRQFHGVLFTELREKRGLNYGNYAYAEHFHQAGWSTLGRQNVARTQQDLSIWIRPVEPQNAIFAARGATHFLRRLVKEGVDKSQFEVARGFLTGYTRLWDQTDQQRLGFAIDEKLYGTPEYLENFRKALQEMTPEAVHEAVKKHVSAENLSYVFVAKDAKGLADALKKGDPSPITYPTPKDAAVLEADKAIIVEKLPIDPAKVTIIPADTFMER